jgi:hypothetical protein
METLTIKISNSQQAHQLYDELLHRKGIQSVAIEPTPKPKADAVTLASETSLAESWLTADDDHWDDYYAELCIKKAI